MIQDINRIREVLQRNRNELLAKANVVATGLGYKMVQGKRDVILCIVCSVERKVPVAELSAPDLIPTSLSDVPTDVVATGPIRALQARTGRHRPAPGGVSIGHRDTTAGTLGCLVRKNNRTHILSNNHVLANSNEARLGDPILQPGSFDGGRLPGDHVAELTEFVPIRFLGAPSDCSIAGAVVSVLNTIAKALGSDTRLQAVTREVGENLVDAAIARPLDDQLVTPEILEIGSIQGQGRGELGAAIRKSGRTTGLTTGEILQVDVTVDVQYGVGRLARFTDQLLAGPMSQGGDSGSAVLDARNLLVGLLFAGSVNTTIINRIEHVFSALGVSL
ncbi:MAG: hypothetical protein HYY39_07455 [Armatimonadetes bacterium]|nr:hypothetical protein [Armatimonadota bacterium]